MSNTRIPNQKQCQACGRTFECFHDSTCWCVQYRISKEWLEYLRKHYTDCLCPDCLKKYAESSATSGCE